MRYLLQVLAHDHIVVLVCLIVIHEVHGFRLRTLLKIRRRPTSRMTGGSILRARRQLWSSGVRKAAAVTLATNHGSRYVTVNVQHGLVAMNVSQLQDVVLLTAGSHHIDASVHYGREEFLPSLMLRRMELRELHLLGLLQRL